jgi:hypothetical protein
MSLITYIELEIEVDYDYQPSEQATNTYPGCESSVDLNAVYVGGIDILNALTTDYNLGESAREELIQKCFDTEEPSLLENVDFPELGEQLKKLSVIS